MKVAPVAAEALAGRDMAHDAWPAADRVPTLTEVVELDSLFPTTQIPADETGLDLLEALPPTANPAFEPVAPRAAELSAEVLFELEQRIGTVLEARLREALAPALARAADALIREARQELAQTLRELVDESVTSALERRTHL
jgi:hypothetical protein